MSPVSSPSARVLVTMTDLGQFHADNYISMLRFAQENIDAVVRVYLLYCNLMYLE